MFHNVNQVLRQGKRTIDAHLIEAVRTSNPLENVVSERVNLRRSGSQFRGSCPFHSERTPSFYVHPAKGRFYCHGCQVGGDVFAFTMKALNCSFREAVTILASRAGIPVNGFRPSRELIAQVRAHKAEMERERHFTQFADWRIKTVSDTYRHLGRAAAHAEEFLQSALADPSPHLHDQAWDAITRYIDFGMRIEREGLLDLDIIRAEWREHAAA
jgi:DNA primase